jgi:putative hydrolase of HD superfamily
VAKAQKSKTKRDLEFLFEIGSLRNVQRLWRQHFGMDVANDLEHTIRVVWLALIMARMEKVKNEEKVMKMALIHDIPETRTADHGHVHKSYVTSDEDKAAHDIFMGTSLANLEDLLHEYKLRKSVESKIVKDADNLDVDFELRELLEKGSTLPKKWLPGRKIVRKEKLYTKSAKQIWDLLQKTDSADWHISANKWLKLAKAGK